VLDFDLGGLSFEPVPGSGQDATAPATDVHDLEFDMSAFTPAASSTEAPAALPADDLSFDLAFDTDFDAPTTLTAQPLQPGDNPAEEMRLDMSLDGPATEIDMADLAREFDLSTPPTAPDAATPAGTLNDPLFELDAMNFDAPATPAVAAAPRAEEANEHAGEHANEHVFDFDTMDFSLPEAPVLPAAVSFDLPVPGATPTPPPVPGSLRHFDMSGIDLDLPQVDSAAVQDGAAVGDAGEMSAAQMEMETKLDLAIAYQEIGDKEGARELLDEVIKGGSSEQVSKANAMRANLA
jgi:pilus assembly protein FimV